jgi:hypothetical protein
MLIGLVFKLINLSLSYQSKHIIYEQSTKEDAKSGLSSQYRDEYPR